MKGIRRSDAVVSKIERMETQLRKQLDKGVADEYNKHIPVKYNENSEHNDSLTQVLEQKLENFQEPDDSVANDTRSEIVQDYHRASNKKFEKMMEKKVTRREARQIEKEKQDFRNAVMDYSNGNKKSNLREIIEEQNKLISYKTPHLDSSHLYIPRDKVLEQTGNGPVFAQGKYNMAQSQQASPSPKNQSLNKFTFKQSLDECYALSGDTR